MLNKYNRYKLLRLFLDSPTESFRLREIARLTKISPPSVINYLKEFEKEGLNSLHDSYLKQAYRVNLVQFPP